jgi:YHS domain-containing protein
MLAFDYKKDPSCGMPLTAGVEDTLHYKGKLYGFCSKECKDAFLKDPASYVAQAK